MKKPVMLALAATAVIAGAGLLAARPGRVTADHRYRSYANVCMELPANHLVHSPYTEL